MPSWLLYHLTERDKGTLKQWELKELSSKTDKQNRVYNFASITGSRSSEAWVYSEYGKSLYFETNRTKISNTNKSLKHWM